MYLLPLIRGSRSIVACTFFPNHPIIAIASSEIISYVVPFINKSPLYVFNNMILFLFYFYFYNDYAVDIINKFKNKYIINYLVELISLLSYLLIYHFHI